MKALHRIKTPEYAKPKFTKNESILLGYLLVNNDCEVNVVIRKDWRGKTRKRFSKVGQGWELSYGRYMKNYTTGLNVDWSKVHISFAY